MNYIYANKSPSGYYVYAYLRKSNFTPYYIGKGTGSRAYDNSSHMIKPPKDKSLIVFIETNLTELGAFARERELIRWYGRKDLGTGILHNRTDGGEGASGLVVSIETRQKLSRAGKQRPSPSKETRDKLRNAQSGKRHSKERCQNISRSKVGICFWNNGIINTTSKECPGPGWVKGRLMSKHHSQSISIANSKRVISEEQKNKSREAQLGNTWWNNGTINTTAKSCPGIEWVPGRLPPKSMKGCLKSEETKARMREAWKIRKEKDGISPALELS